MMIRRLVALGVMLIPLPISPQQGSIRYDHSEQAGRGDLFGQGDRGGGLRGRQGTRDGAGRRAGGLQGIRSRGRAGIVLLTFNTSESLMRTSILDEPPAPSPADGAGRHGFARRRIAAASRSANEEILSAYTHFADDLFRETRKFMGRKFVIREPRPTYEWRLVGEQSEFLGYMVQKATAVQDSTTIEAWFTPQIPVSTGPGPYAGLPGLILVVSINRGEELYSAIEIDLSDLEEGAIVAPEEGDTVTRVEYETMVEDKLRELRSTRRRIR